VEPTRRDKWGNILAPVSVKGIVIEGGDLWLRRNEFGKWELPGGRPEDEEQPEETVVREINEELGLEVTVDRLVDVYLWSKDFGTNPNIWIITFLCAIERRSGDLELEGEGGAAEYTKVSFDAALHLPDLPDVYKRALQKASIAIRQ
jgi:8-oxo-dGTP pyrophosphatase MutT (NUDIX family)